MKYPSKIDWWIGALIFVLVPIILSYSIWQAPDISSLYVAIGSALFYLITLWALIFPIHYTLTDEQLIVQSGVYKQSIKLSAIKGVYPSKNPLSSPALSIHRLKIACDRRYPLLISPQNRERFMTELELRAPQLQRKDDSLISQ